MAYMAQHSFVFDHSPPRSCPSSWPNLSFSGFFSGFRLTALGFPVPLLTILDPAPPPPTRALQCTYHISCRASTPLLLSTLQCSTLYLTLSAPHPTLPLLNSAPSSSFYTLSPSLFDHASLPPHPVLPLPTRHAWHPHITRFLYPFPSMRLSHCLRRSEHGYSTSVHIFWRVPLFSYGGLPAWQSCTTFQPPRSPYLFPLHAF